MSASLSAKFFRGAAILLAGAAWARAASAGQGSMTDFQFAGGYGQDGYKTWDISGIKAQRAADQSAPVVITQMTLLLYGGGAALPIETTIVSSQATVDTGQSRVQGSDKLVITGANNSYQVSGNDWFWDGKDAANQHIHLGRNVYVNFQGKAAVPPAVASPPIKIFSERLDIYQKTDEQGRPQNRFEFSGNVNVHDGNSTTTCQNLVVLAERSAALNPAAPAGSPAFAPPASLEVGPVQHIVATDQVEVAQGDLDATGQQAEMFPDTQRVVLSGSPQMQDHKSDTILQGSTITWLRDQQEIQVDPPADAPGAPGRVRVSLPPLASYQTAAPAGGVPDPARLIITGESLRGQFGPNQRTFQIENSVHVEDPDLTVDADQLDAEFNPLLPTAAGAPNPDLAANVPQMGKLNHLGMKGNVTIRQYDNDTNQQPILVTTAPQAEILPEQNEILLSGGPRVVDPQSSAVMSGERITITRDGQAASVTGSATHPTTLQLPPIPGLGGVLGAGVNTMVTSDQVDLQRNANASVFTFTGNVVAQASDLSLKCKTLEVDTDNAPPPPGADPLSPEIQLDKIRELVASDEVEITQNDYKAHAARAEIFPQARADTTGAGADAQSYRAVQLYGASADASGPARPEVDLPPLHGVNMGATPAGNLTVTPNTVPTIITSDQQWLLSSPAGSTYHFEGNVHIDGGILQATCDKMSVFGSPSAVADPAKPGTTEMTLERVLMEGAVRIVNGTMVSTADHAEILPIQKPPIATLSGNVLVVDPARNNFNLKNADVIIHLDTRQVEAVPPPAQPGQKAERPTFQTGSNLFDKGTKPGDKPAAGSPP